MQEMCCKLDYNKEAFRERAREIVFQGNLISLSEINTTVNELFDCNIKLLPLDHLILSYIYHVWMPKDLRDDFKAIKTYLILHESLIIQFIAKHGTEGLLDEKRYSDIYMDIIIAIADETIYKYTNRQFGKEREKNPISKYLFDMIASDFSQIQDDLLSLLFIAYHYYADELFASDFETDLFKTFIYNKKSLLMHSEENSVIASIEDKLREMEF